MITTPLKIPHLLLGKRYVKRWPLTAPLVGATAACVTFLGVLVTLARNDFDWVSKPLLVAGALQFVYLTLIAGSIVNLFVARYPDRPS